MTRLRFSPKLLGLTKKETREWYVLLAESTSWEAFVKLRDLAQRYLVAAEEASYQTVGGKNPAGEK